MAVLAALALVCLLLALPRLLEKWRLYRAMSRLPGPPGLPIVGNLLELFDLISPDRYEKLMGLCRQHRTVLRLWLSSGFQGVFLMEPEDIKTILGNPVLGDKPESLYGVLKEPFSPGLVFHPRKVWKPIRAAVAKSLHKSVLSTFVPTFCKNSTRIAIEIEQLADKDSTFEITPLCGRVANLTIIDTVLSSDNRDVSDDDRNAYIEVLTKGNQMIMRRLWRPWLHNDWLFSLTKDWKTYHYCIKILKKLIKHVISHKQETVAREKLAGKLPTKGRRSFVDHVLASDTPFEGDLEVESRLLMLAASVSSMEALSFMYYALAIRQDLQAAIVKYAPTPLSEGLPALLPSYEGVGVLVEHVFQELDEVFGGDLLRPVEDDDLPHLEVTERFVKEILRFFPSLPMFARHIPMDVKLPSGYTLPRGCSAVFFLPAVHRDPRWWERPDEFDPDRFLPENSRGRHPYAYLPFSAGPRNCVGFQYSLLFLKTHLATLLRRLELLPAPGVPSRVEDIPIALNLTISISGGARIRAKRRARVLQ